MLPKLGSHANYMQDAFDEHEEAKNWLVARVLQQENEVAEINDELDRAKEQCEKQERMIESLNAQVRATFNKGLHITDKVASLVGGRFSYTFWPVSCTGVGTVTVPCLPSLCRDVVVWRLNLYHNWSFSS